MAPWPGNKTALAVPGRPLQGESVGGQTSVELMALCVGEWGCQGGEGKNLKHSEKTRLPQQRGLFQARK